MNTDLLSIIETISCADGSITLNDLSNSQIYQLNDLVVYKYPVKGNSNHYIKFSDKLFRVPNAGKGIVVNSGNPLIDYQVKSIVLLLMHSGTKEGGEVYKWSTVYQRARKLLLFANFIATDYQINSFFSLSSMPEIKLRTILLDFLNSPESKGGLDYFVHPSSAKALIDSLKFLSFYGLASDVFYDLLVEICRPRISESKSTRLKHTVVPTQIMKMVIKESVDYMCNCKKRLPDLTRLFESLYKEIDKSNKFSKPESSGMASNLGGKLKKIIKEEFFDIRLHAYTLILAFTGMRDSECIFLKNNCQRKFNEAGENHYFVKALLKKTDEGEIELDWIANKEVYEAVEILSKVNELFILRAERVISRYGDKLSSETLYNYQNGIEANRLFGCPITLTTTRFSFPYNSTSRDGGLSFTQIRFCLTKKDIEQLESLNCNYKSVSKNSGFRGAPYQVGDIFLLTPHQFRHTFAWFVIANRLGDLDDIKYQYKHLTNAMSFVYSERGFDSLDELRNIVEYFEDLFNEHAVEDIVNSAKDGRIAGGGGERLDNIIRKLNEGSSEVYFSTDYQPVLGKTEELVEFITRHSDSVRGLPHGYCLKGVACKIKNASDPSHCLYCDTYYVTPKHLPYWQGIKINCERKIDILNSLPSDKKKQYSAFLCALTDNLSAANEIIETINKELILVSG
jgi:hypothetical protein